MGCDQSTANWPAPAPAPAPEPAPAPAPEPALPSPLTGKEVEEACRAGDMEVLAHMLRRSRLRYENGHKDFSAETDPIAVAFNAGLESVVDGLFALIEAGSPWGACPLEGFMYMLEVVRETGSAPLLEKIVGAFPHMFLHLQMVENTDGETYYTSCTLAVLSVACEVGSVPVAKEVLICEQFDPKAALRLTKKPYFLKLRWAEAYPDKVRYVPPGALKGPDHYWGFTFERNYGSFDDSRKKSNPFVVASTPEILELLLSDFRLSPIAHDNLPLLTYIRRGRVDLLEVLAADPRVDWQIPKLLSLALCSRNPEVAEFVLDRLDATALTRKSGENFLRIAAQSREPAVLEVLLARLPDQRKARAWIKAAAKDVLHISESADEMLGLMEPLLASGLRPELASELAHLVVTIKAKRYPDLPDRQADFLRAAFLRAALADPRFDPAGCDNAAVKAAAESGSEELVSLLMSDPRVNPQAAGPSAPSAPSDPPAYTPEEDIPPPPPPPAYFE